MRQIASAWFFASAAASLRQRLIGPLGLGIVALGFWGFAVGPLMAQGSKRLDVVELFSSQGCSSCPPADAVLTSLSGRPGILALTWPVDYWDRMGWRDTHGKAEHTERQKAYNKRLGRSGIFTPQLFVNGTYQAVGSRRSDIEAALIESRADTGIWVTPGLALDADGLRLSLPDVALKGPVTLEIVGFSSGSDVTVKKGENRGRSLHYTNVVHWSDLVGPWSGEAEDLLFTLSVDRLSAIDHLALLVHLGEKDGPILGAASLALPLQSTPATASPAAASSTTASPVSR